MRTLGMFIVFICTLIFVIIGGLLIALAFNFLSIENLTDFFRLTFQVQNIHFIVGGFGLFLVLASILIAQITLGKMQKEKTIAFNNPDGQVTVSLSAVEDFIKRLSSSIAEIRDLRPTVIAGKKGIEIDVRISLWADVNIPAITESIQTTIKNRIQEMLGIEEPIAVRIHVGKIVEKEKKRSKKKGKEEEATFQGSIEYGKD